MNNVLVRNEVYNENISDLIYEVRGKQVMLDSMVSVTKCT